jgi:predicted nucleic acid-binding protein
VRGHAGQIQTQKIGALARPPAGRRFAQTPGRGTRGDVRLSVSYPESSAVLAWLLGESQSQEVIAKVGEADAVVASVLTLLEIRRALIRAERQNILTAGECRKLGGMLARASSGWVLMEISEPLRERAARAFPAEPLRTLDALHLATALFFMQVYPNLQILT